MNPNPNKKPVALFIIVAIIIVAIIIWLGRASFPGSSSDLNNASSTFVAVSETTKVSNSLSEYQNSELGFAVKYPSAWEKEETNAGVTFIVPIDQSQVSTMGTLQANVQIVPGTCAFPPVTTIKDRGSVKVGSDTLDMVSMSNTVQGRNYFNRMYSLQHGDVCYIFSFASVALSPSSKGLSGSNITQAQNNNRALTTTADTDFTNMVKSFVFVYTPEGQSETQAAPARK